MVAEIERAVKGLINVSLSGCYRPACGLGGGRCKQKTVVFRNGSVKKRFVRLLAFVTGQWGIDRNVSRSSGWLKVFSHRLQLVAKVGRRFLEMAKHRAIWSSWCANSRSSGHHCA